MGWLVEIMTTTVFRCQPIWQCDYQHTVSIGICFILISYLISVSASPLSITGSNCENNVSIKYQIPVSRTRPLRHTQYHTQHYINNNNNDNHSSVIENDTTTNGSTTESYVEYVARVRWETTKVCCPGYRKLLFGFCEPICDTPCPSFSYCGTPNQCECMPGYEEHHPNNKDHQLDCRPICVGGCPEHSYCAARNRCECRLGFKDTSKWWFLPLHCERIRCLAHDQRYDPVRHMCVKIEMSMEELMQKVAARLAKGLSDDSATDDDEDV